MKESTTERRRLRPDDGGFDPTTEGTTQWRRVRPNGGGYNPMPNGYSFFISFPCIYIHPKEGLPFLGYNIFIHYSMHDAYGQKVEHLR